MADVMSLLGLGGQGAGTSVGSDSEPNKVIPHVLTFGSILNTIAKTYSFRFDEALRHLPKNALAMRRDCFIRALLNERKLPVSQLSWQIEVDDENDPNQKKVKEGIDAMLRSIKRFTRMRLYLLDAEWYGRYGAQGEWERKPVNREPLWCFGNHSPVNGDKIQYAWDGTPSVAISALAAKNYPSESVKYTDRFPVLKLERPEWRRQFVIHTHEVDDADYFEGEMAGAAHGIGLRSQIYWSWWLRDECLGWIMDVAQKVGTLGILIFWYEEGNKAAKLQAETNAQAASTKVAFVMPRPGGKDTLAGGVEHIPASPGGIDMLMSVISDYFERHMERLVVGQTMSANSQGPGLGTAGIADMHKDTKFQLLKFDAANLDETLTDDLVGVAVQLNYPWCDFPVRFVSNVPDPEAVEKMEAVGKVWDRLAFKENEVRALTGMSEPQPGDKTVGGMALPDPNGEPFGGLLSGQPKENQPAEPAVAS